MSNLSGKGLAAHCISKIGTPYVYGAKGNYGKLTQAHLNALTRCYPNVFTDAYITKAMKYVGRICTDCSGLISWYTGKVIGSYQMYKTASERHSIATVGQAPVGAVLWRPGHVGVKINGTYSIEAKGINYGTVKTEIKKARFTHWLLFDDINYDRAVTSHKELNPYKEPAAVIDKGCIGEAVRWVQWELREAGFCLEIDGDCGTMTDKAIREFQQSCKICIDGKVGPVTRNALKIN